MAMRYFMFTGTFLAASPPAHLHRHGDLRPLLQLRRPPQQERDRDGGKDRSADSPVRRKQRLENTCGQGCPRSLRPRGSRRLPRQFGCSPFSEGHLADGYVWNRQPRMKHNLHRLTRTCGVNCFTTFPPGSLLHQTRHDIRQSQAARTRLSALLRFSSRTRLSALRFTDQHETQARPSSRC